jgi:hypothetical protein
MQVDGEAAGSFEGRGVPARDRLGAHIGRAHEAQFFESCRRRDDVPKRRRATLPGVAEPAAQQFVRSLGAKGNDFTVSLGGAEPLAVAEAVAAADDRIGVSSPTLAVGEGGIIHYRNAYPDDPHLRLWSGLVSEARGHLSVAASEFEAATALGLSDGRADAYRVRCA